MTTTRTLYRDENSQWYLSKGPELSVFHPDDFLDGKTTLHTFPSQGEAEAFECELQTRANREEENITWSEIQQIENENRFGIIVEEHEKPHPGREVLEINY